MSKPGEALTRMYRETEKRNATIGRRLESAQKVYERRERERIRPQQAMLRAAFYERHPELAA